MSKEEYFCQALRRLSQKKDCCQLSYAIIRNANYKSENLAGLYKHNERKNTHYSNPEINKNNFHKKLFPQNLPHHLLERYQNFAT